LQTARYEFKSNSSPRRVVIIPMHDQLAKGTLKSILEQAGITLDEFLKYL
jgi:predicted RNA binding protein YcfA (HicA-like mRNA interferase family)